MCSAGSAPASAVFWMASRISSGNANSADGYEMTVISAAVIGGVSLSGGVGTMYGTMIGVLIVGVISNGMDILGINTYFQQILQAAIIFTAVYIDVHVNPKEKLRERRDKFCKSENTKNAKTNIKIKRRKEGRDYEKNEEDDVDSFSGRSCTWNGGMQSV